MKDQKTVKEWLETLDEPYRSQALENLNPQYADILENDLIDALSGAFDWGDSPEDFEYWEDIGDRIYDNRVG